jgi:hypothetical protein
LKVPGKTIALDRLPDPQARRVLVEAAGGRQRMSDLAKHDWVESSGTTDICRKCGCTKYHQDARGTPGRYGVTRYARWVNGNESRMPAESRWARDA